VTSPRPRPDPARWLWYAYGGRLPARYRDWVLHDNTDRTWMTRHLLRVGVQALPVLAVAFVLLFLFTPVPIGVIIGVLVVGLLVSVFLMIGTAREFAAVRLARHGFPPDVTPPPSRLVPEDAGRSRGRR
jgi:hypothetical protein